MNTEKALSKFLQRVVDGKLISEAVAKRFNELETPALQLQAIKEWSAASDQAALDLANRLSGKEVKVLYDSRTPQANGGEWVNAIGDDLLDRYMPSLGRVGYVIRDRISQSWQKITSGETRAPRWVRRLFMGAVILWLVSFLWGPLWWLVQAPFRMTSSLRERFGRSNPPAITQGIATLPPVVRVETPIVQAPTQPPVVAVVPAPRNLHWDRSGAHGVHLMWESPGAGYHYNVYAAYAGDHPAFDIGNDAPLDGPEITWIAPAEGTPVFEIYLKAVDPQGRESAASNHIIADLR